MIGGYISPSKLNVKTVSIYILLYINHHGTSLGLLAETFCEISRDNNPEVISSNPSSCAHNFKQRKVVFFFLLECYWESEQHQNCLWDLVLQHLCPSTCWLCWSLNRAQVFVLCESDAGLNRLSNLFWIFWLIHCASTTTLVADIVTRLCIHQYVKCFFSVNILQRRLCEKNQSTLQPIRWRQCGNLRFSHFLPIFISITWQTGRLSEVAVLCDLWQTQW